MGSDGGGQFGLELGGGGGVIVWHFPWYQNGLGTYSLSPTTNSD